MRGLIADFRHAARVYFRTPFSTGLAILALAVAMAFVSAFLSLWNDLALQPHPGYEDSGRLVTVAMSNGDTMAGTTITLMEDISDNVSLVEGVTTDQRTFSTVTIGSERIAAQGEMVAKRYFPVLRPKLHLGRGFEARDHDPDAEPVVILGYDFWQRHFDGRRDVIGEQIGVEIQTFAMQLLPGNVQQPGPRTYQYRIVGVADPGLSGTFSPTTEIWFPFEQMASLQQTDPEGEPISIAELYERAAGLTGVGRLAPGATVEALQAELDRRYTADNYAIVQSRSAQGMRLTAIAGVHLDLKARREGLRQINLFLAGTVLLALVAACNTSLFLLSRAPGRLRELAIRTSLGATARRLTRQLVSEASLLVLPAVLAGLVVSLWLVVVLKDMSLFQTVRWRDVSPIDWRVLGIISLFTIGLVSFVSLAPALGLRRPNIGAASRTVSARAGLGQTIAGSVQLVVACVLGAIAVAFGAQLIEYLYADAGFEMDDVVVVRMTPSAIAAGGVVNVEAMRLAEQRQREILTALPGVESVSFTGIVPGQSTGFTMSLPRAQIAPTSSFGDREEAIAPTIVQVQPNFPDLLELRFIEGRSFAGDDASGVLVNESAARLLWGRTDVVGEPVGAFAAGGPAGSAILGVFRDVRFRHPSEGEQPMIVISTGSQSRIALLKTPSSPATLRELINDRIESGELEIVLIDVQSLASSWRQIFATDITRMLMTGAAALITVLLAALGTYGTQRFTVIAGRREYAIRAALGAGPKAVGRLVLRRGILMSLPALGFGLLLAFVTVSLLRDDYFTAATSPLLVTAVTALAMCLLLASAIIGPVRQARRTQPAPLLRED